MKAAPVKDRAGNELCRGFLATRIDRDAGQILERRFARLNDGTILVSAEVKAPCDEFNKPGVTWETWTADSEMPIGLEFIGYYPVPTATI